MSELSDPKWALAMFIQEMKTDYERWYLRATRTTYAFFVLMQLTVMLCGLATAIIAALVDAKQFESQAKVALVVLPLISSFTASLMVQFKLYDMWRLREDGRIQFQGLVSEGRQRMAATDDAGQISAIHQDLQARAQAIEIQQGASFFGLFEARQAAKVDP